LATGKQHSYSTSVLAGIILSNSFLLHEFDYVIMSIGCFVGILLSPDLDVDNGNISNYLLRRIWKPIEKLWFIYWFPYRKLLKHRSFLSHFPVISTFGRIVYISIPIVILSFYIDINIHYWNLWFVFGLMFSDLLHYLMDKV